MKKYWEQLQGLAGRFGWGVVISSFSYVNGLLVLTAGLACFFLCLVCHLIGIYPAPPEQTGNLISIALYVMIMVLYGWFVWSLMATHLLFPLGAAFSILDLMAARKNNNAELYRGSVAGLCLAALPIALWFQNGNSDAALTALAMPLIRAHF